MIVNECEWKWLFWNDFEWLGIITWWIIRWTSTFWWIEIKNLFSTDGYPMMIMTKFMKKKIQSNSRHMQCLNFEVWNLNVSQKSLEIHEYSGIWNFVITVIKIFFTAVRNLLPRVVNINYTGLDLTSTRWFLVERTGWKNTG